MRGVALLIVACALAAPAAAYAETGGASYAPSPRTPAPTGGAAPIRPIAPVAPVAAPAPGAVARIVDGIAIPPAAAPPAVQEAILRANRIIGKPYLWGGGHRTWRSRGYDCSGSVSYALHGAGLLASPLDSSSLESWGQAGPGQWVTVYTNPAHAYMTIAGIRLDTSAAGDPHGLPGPRWRPLRSSNAGFHTRHPAGL